MIDEKKLIEMLERLKTDCTKYMRDKHKYFNVTSMEYFMNRLIEYVNRLAEKENKENGKCEEM